MAAEEIRPVNVYSEFFNYTDIRTKVLEACSQGCVLIRWRNEDTMNYETVFDIRDPKTSLAAINYGRSLLVDIGTTESLLISTHDDTEILIRKLPTEMPIYVWVKAIKSLNAFPVDYSSDEAEE